MILPFPDSLKERKGENRMPAACDTRKMFLGKEEVLKQAE
jgi:hypothetical protein